MATSVVTLPASTARSWTWTGDARPTVTLGTVSRRLSFLSLEAAFQRLTVDGGDLPSAWEVNPSALTLRQGTAEVVIPGPAAPGQFIVDSDTPYQWFLASSVSYATLNFGQTVDLIFDDGVEPVTLEATATAGTPSVGLRFLPTIVGVADAGSPSVSVGLRALPVKADLAAGTPGLALRLASHPHSADVVAGSPTVGAGLRAPPITGSETAGSPVASVALSAPTLAASPSAGRPAGSAAVPTGALSAAADADEPSAEVAWPGPGIAAASTGGPIAAGANLVAPSLSIAADAGSPTVAAALRRSPPSLAVQVAAGLPAGAAELAPSGSFEFSFAIQTIGSSATDWTDIGVSDTSDDVPVLPRSLVASGDAAAVDLVRVRRNQLRIQFSSGDGRFRQSVENSGRITVVDPSGSVLAVVRMFAGEWNSNRDRYQINDDSLFVQGTLASLNSAVRLLGTGARVRFFIWWPPVEIAAEATAGMPNVAAAVRDPSFDNTLAVTSAADAPAASVELSAPTFAGSLSAGRPSGSAAILAGALSGNADAGEPEVSARLGSHPHSVDVVGGTPTVGAALRAPTLEGALSAGAPAASVGLPSPTIGAAASAGSPSATARSAVPTLSGDAVTGTASVRARLEAPPLSIAVDAGDPAATVALRRPPPVLAARVAAGAPTGAAELAPSGSFEFSFAIQTIGSSATDWTDIGVSDTSDDVPVLPRSLVASGDAAAVDLVRVRRNQLRIQFSSGDGRFRQSVENSGRITVVDPSGSVLAVVRMFAGEWNSNRDRYQINDDSLFVQGTLASLNSAVRLLGTGARVRFFVWWPPVEVSATATAGVPDVRTELADPSFDATLAVTADAGAPAATVAWPAPGIAASAAAGSPAAIAIFPGQPLSAATVAGTVSVEAKLEAPPLGGSAGAGSPDVVARLMAHPHSADLVAGVPSVAASLGAPSLAAALDADGPQVTARFAAPALAAMLSSAPPRTSVRFLAPTLSAEADGAAATVRLALRIPGISASATIGALGTASRLAAPSLAVVAVSMAPLTRAEIERITVFRSRVPAGQPDVRAGLRGPTLAAGSRSGTPDVAVLWPALPFSALASVDAFDAAAALKAPPFAVAAVTLSPDVRARLALPGLAISRAAGDPDVVVLWPAPSLAVLAVSSAPLAEADVERITEFRNLVLAGQPDATADIQGFDGVRLGQLVETGEFELIAELRPHFDRDTRAEAMADGAVDQIRHAIQVLPVQTSVVVEAVRNHYAVD